jgi:aminopeptidase N
VPTDDDGAFVVGEPQGAPGWFAANDTPTDKATYDVQLTVPDELTAVGNGALIS